MVHHQKRPNHSVSISLSLTTVVGALRRLIPFYEHKPLRTRLNGIISLSTQFHRDVTCYHKTSELFSVIVELDIHFAKSCRDLGGIYLLVLDVVQDKRWSWVREWIVEYFGRFLWKEPREPACSFKISRLCFFRTGGYFLGRGSSGFKIRSHPFPILRPNAKCSNPS
jgi:hypothetical protein